MPLSSIRRCSLLALVLAALAGCTWLPWRTPATQTASGTPVVAQAIAIAAHPLAAEAARQMLREGGSAVDAAIAAQMVLGLVEPQSSGVGGGAVALYWDATARQLSSVDGLAAAPALSTAALDVDVDGHVLPAEQVRRGGRSVGVPGALVTCEWLHRRYGKLPWARLFEPAIRHARDGFALPAYLHSLLLAPNARRDHPDFADLFFDAHGEVLPVGTRIVNLGYAHTMNAIAELGARGWLIAGGAREIVAAAQRGAMPGLIREADLLAYRVEPREPLCAMRLRHRVCVMGPSSFGGIAVLQMLGMLESAGGWRFDDAAFVHRYAEAGRVATADRLRHVGDPGFVHVPTRELLDARYLATRAAAIAPRRAASSVAPGEFPPSPTARGAAIDEVREHADATSQVVVVDSAGNALTLTTTINLNFGSRLVAGGVAAGVVLNDALTNFSAAPHAGEARPNAMAPGKRAVTSMAPTMVFGEDGQPLIVGGSAGGAPIVDYVAQALIEMLAHARTPAAALAAGHVGAGETVQLERGTPAADLAPALQAMGHRVAVTEMRSGLGFARRGAQGWQGAADPRRDGVALTLP